MDSSSQSSQSGTSIPDRTIIIVFGASGDLTRRKLMPALYHLSREGLIPVHFQIVGIGRRILENDDFRYHMRNRVRQYCSHKMESRFWNPLADNMQSIKSDYKEKYTYDRIKDICKELENEWGGEINKLFYLATSPSHFSLIINSIAQNGLNKQENNGWTRIIIEKPFGLNLDSAINLNNTLNEYFSEDQIYRIDHFLGKEAVQNILIFRMSNILFQPLWNREYIEHIQITSVETVGVEGRVDFFEQTGAARDMIQSHLLQILAFLTMDIPKDLNPESIRDEKVLLLKSIRKLKPEEVDQNTIRGQYREGVVRSELVKRYLDEDGVEKDSKVETYAAVKLFIDNYRWRGVPFYLRTGKRMPNRKTEVFIQLKAIEGKSILSTLTTQAPIPNTIKLEIQPRAGIDLTIGWKPAGLLSEVEPTDLTLGGTADIKEPKAYERLLVDALRGDSTLFIRFDEIREMWKIIDPIVDCWKKSIDKNLYYYPAGTQGPKQAKEFITRDSFEWSEI